MTWIHDTTNNQTQAKKTKENLDMKASLSARFALLVAAALFTHTAFAAKEGVVQLGVTTEVLRHRSLDGHHALPWALESYPVTSVHYKPKPLCLRYC